MTKMESLLDSFRMSRTRIEIDKQCQIDEYFQRMLTLDPNDFLDKESVVYFVNEMTKEVVEYATPNVKPNYKGEI